jgi:hypothetical protein
MTDSNGVAKLNITDPQTGFNARVDIGNTSVVNAYTATYQTVADETPTPSYVRNVTVALVQPNIRGVLTEKTLAGTNAVVPFTWVELYDETNNRWVGGSGTDINGAFSLNAPGNNVSDTLYTLTVNPSQNSGTLNSRQVYSVLIPRTSGVTAPVISVKGSLTPLVPSSSSGKNVWSFSLAAPSVTGVVKDSSGNPIANSWVVPIDKATNENYWQYGSNSRSGGIFSMALGDGTYLLEANTPGGNSTETRSARCEVTIVSGAITNLVGGCIQSGTTAKTVTLSLRAPNLTFTLVDSNDAPVAYANIGIGMGNWNTWAQSSSTGKVSIFVDNQAIANANVINGGVNGMHLHLWVDPPWGSSDLVRWDCNAGDAPRCTLIPDITAASIATEYPSTNAGRIAFAAPNTKLQVTLPNGNPAGQGAWVSIFNQDINGNRQWIAGGNTDKNGYASFNLDLVAINKLIVEVNAPYDKRSTYSSKTYDNAGVGFNQDAVNNHMFALASPNVTFTVKSPGGVGINKWGWISLEQCIANDCNNLSWNGGYGLDDKGRVSVILPSRGAGATLYKITAYPSGGRAGTRTSCIVSVTSDVATTTCTPGNVASAPAASVLDLTITLGNGNVTGVVNLNGVAFVGAVVYANTSVNGVWDANPATAVVTSTNTDGRFSLQLDPTQTWEIRILPVGHPELASPQITSLTFAGDGTDDLGTINLTPKAV